MATLVGFGCEAFFYGAFSATTGDTSRLLVYLGSHTVLLASINPYEVVPFLLDRSVNGNHPRKRRKRQKGRKRLSRVKLALW
jgi:hypothetical protein